MNLSPTQTLIIRNALSNYAFTLKPRTLVTDKRLDNYRDTIVLLNYFKDVVREMEMK